MTWNTILVVSRFILALALQLYVFGSSLLLRRNAAPFRWSSSSAASRFYLRASSFSGNLRRDSASRQLRWLLFRVPRTAKVCRPSPAKLPRLLRISAATPFRLSRWRRSVLPGLAHSPPHFAPGLTSVKLESAKCPITERCDLTLVAAT